MTDGLKLLVVDGFLKGREFFLVGGSTTIGRLPDNDIVLDEPSISRNHAQLDTAGGVFTVRDKGSYNGVTVDGKRVEHATLRLGEMFRLGDLAFQIVNAADPIEPSALGAPSAPVAPSPPPAEQAAAPRPRPVTAPAVLEPGVSQAGLVSAGADLAPAPLDAPGALEMPDPYGVAGLPEEMPAAAPAGSSRIRLFGALGAGLLLAGVAALVLLSMKRPPAVSNFILRAGEKKLVETQPAPGGEPIRFSRAIPLQPAGEGRYRSAARMLEAEPYEPDARTGLSDVVLLRAVDPVPEGVQVFLKRGDTVVQIVKVVVRGSVEPASRAYYDHLSPSERKRLARDFIIEGQQAQSTDLARAIDRYRTAIRAAPKTGFENQVETEAKRLLKEAREDLERRYQEHRFMIRQASNINEYWRMARELQAITALIPDTNDLRHQKAAIYLRRLKRRGVLK